MLGDNTKHSLENGEAILSFGFSIPPAFQSKIPLKLDLDPTLEKGASFSVDGVQENINLSYQGNKVYSNTTIKKNDT